MVLEVYPLLLSKPVLRCIPLHVFISSTFTFRSNKIDHFISFCYQVFPLEMFTCIYRYTNILAVLMYSICMCLVKNFCFLSLSPFHL